MPSNASSRSLQTAEEIAALLNVTPRTIYLWAESGRIPVAYRNGRTIRFRQEAVMPAGLATQPGELRSVELVILALSLLLGPEFPRVLTVDLDSITMAEVAEIKRLCSAYQSDLDTLETFQERANYAEGVIAAARAVAN